MSGFTKAAVVFALITFVISAAATYLHAAWCGLPLAIAIGLAVGYIGAYWQKDDPAKTARIARGGAKAGLVAGIAGLAGGIVGGVLNAAAGPDVVNLCLALVTAGLLTIFAWLGGWSWARHEHERQTGYKPT
jgi:nitrate/nitrite transporter NarK